MDLENLYHVLRVVVFTRFCFSLNIKTAFFLFECQIGLICYSVFSGISVSVAD